MTRSRVVERSKRRVADFYADFDARRSKVPFVAGAAFSAADIPALVSVDFATTALKLTIGSRVRDRGRTSQRRRVDVGQPIFRAA